MGRMSLLFCNAIDNSVSRIQPLVELCSTCATVCGVAEILQALMSSEKSVQLYFGIPAAVLWVDHVLFHTGIYESPAKSLHGNGLSRESLSYKFPLSMCKGSVWTTACWDGGSARIGTSTHTTTCCVGGSRCSVNYPCPATARCYNTCFNLVSTSARL